MIKKMLLSSFLFSLPLLSSVKEIEDQSHLSIETPSLAERKEKKIRLKNGLEVLLISDPNTSTSGAALAVHVGSWDDPDDRPGMAHFVEHLLFLGTEKYPEESAYTRHLDEHGGQRNAFTMADRTVYMFSINHSGFDEALDRFGQFFISPLFNPSGVAREMQAIDQEYNKNIPLDVWRGYYVKKEMANAHHPFHRFCMGNLSSLKQISQEELKEWYNKHYSSDLMHLVIYSNASLEVLEKKAVPLFSQVSKRSFKPETPSQPLFEPTAAQDLVWIQPMQQVQKLEISWELPAKFGLDNEHQTDRLISHILGHEGEGSLLALLKKEGLADELEVGAHKIGRGQALLCLNVHLTNKGIHDYEQVIARCYSAVELLKQQLIPRYIFNEVVQLSELNYTYQSKREVFDYVTDTAASLCDEPLETFPRKTLIPSSYAPEVYREFLSYLTPQNGLHVLVCEEKPTHAGPVQEEKWLGGVYAKLPLSEEVINSWSKQTVHVQLSLPSPNPYLPEQFDLAYQGGFKKSFPTPVKIEDSEQELLYCCNDEQFGVPKVSWNFRLKSPHLDPANPTSQVLADLYCHCMDERLRKKTYPASLAGLSYHLDATPEGLALKIRGFNDKAPQFLQMIAQELHQFKLSKEDFKRYKALAKRVYHNLGNQSALKQGGEHLWKVIYDPYCSVYDKQKALVHLRYEDLTGFASRLWDSVFIEGMLYGNLTQETGKQVAHLLTQAFKTSRPFAKASHPKKRVAHMKEGELPYFVQIASTLPSNAVILTADCGAFDFKKRAAQEILSKGLEEPFFSELRTKQQTAYIVSNWCQEIERELFAFFAIQSSSHEPRDLLSRFELFIESSLQNMTIETLTKERFETIRTALIQRLEDPAENLAKMGELLTKFAFEYDGDFHWLNKRIEGLQGLTYEEFTDYAQQFLGKNNKKRFAVFVDGELPQEQCFEYCPVSSFDKLKEKITYTSRTAALKE